MTPTERDLILSVFDRLSRLAGGPKDREAEALIVERLRAVPDAAYNLVEAVVVQEMTIKENEARIRDLEAQLAARVQAPPQQQAPGFGRSAWGGGRGSVPSTQAPQQQAQQQQYAPQRPSPWGGQPSAGGGFLRTAAGAAVGVAGGMLLANGISSMFAGGHGGSALGAQQASDTGHLPADAAPPSYDTTIADDQGYDGFDSGFDMGGDSF